MDFVKTCRIQESPSAEFISAPATFSSTSRFTGGNGLRIGVIAFRNPHLRSSFPPLQNSHLHPAFTAEMDFVKNPKIILDG
jgi:hypothetical protein